MAGIVCQHVRNFSSSSGRRIFSPNLWRHCPLDIINAGATDYVGFSDDFISGPASWADATYEQHYTTDQDTGVTVTTGTDVENGTLVIAGNDGGNDFGTVRRGGATSGPFVIPDGSGGHPLWFEARIKVASITATYNAFFIGLGEAGMVGNDAAITDTTGVPKVLDLIGFSKLSADGEVDIVYTKASGALQTLATGVGTMVADTYMNLGFYYNPDALSTKRITFYVDNVECNTYVTRTLQDDGTNFPGGEELNAVLATKNAASAASAYTLDWWACYQLG